MGTKLLIWDSPGHSGTVGAFAWYPQIELPIRLEPDDKLVVHRGEILGGGVVGGTQEGIK